MAMGNIFSRSDEDQSRSAARDAKLEAQKIKAFSGNYMDWKLWKKQTKAAFGTTRLTGILDNADSAAKHQAENELVFLHLQVAIAEGHAAHLVDQFEATLDGYLAWQALTEWYDGDTVRHKLAEELRQALENLRLQSTTSASDYINKFKLYTNQLSVIPGESMPTSTLILLLLWNIQDDSYKNLIKQLHYNNAGLDECINQI